MISVQKWDSEQGTLKMMGTVRKTQVGDEVSLRVSTSSAQPGEEQIEGATSKPNLNDFHGPRSSDSERDSAFRSDPKSIDFLDGIRELKIVCFLWGKPDILYLISGVQSRRDRRSQNLPQTHHFHHQERAKIMSASGTLKLGKDREVRSWRYPGSDEPHAKQYEHENRTFHEWDIPMRFAVDNLGTKVAVVFNDCVRLFFACSDGLLRTQLTIAPNFFSELILIGNLIGIFHRSKGKKKM